MLGNKRRFIVAINSKEYERICKWTLEHQNLETGGDLFGLWLDKHTAVMQLVLGPGKACRRTGTSFYQDVQYLGDVGSYLTHKEGLCHIGEWHSHHKLGLTRPSGGDENTVWNNMPRYGLTRFVLIIANITPGESDKAFAGCFLFELDPKTNRRLPVLKGEFHVLPAESPFRLKTTIQKKVQRDAEHSRVLAPDTTANKKAGTASKQEPQDSDEWEIPCLPCCSVM